MQFLFSRMLESLDSRAGILGWEAVRAGKLSEPSVDPPGPDSIRTSSRRMRLVAGGKGV